MTASRKRFVEEEVVEDGPLEVGAEAEEEEEEAGREEETSWTQL